MTTVSDTRVCLDSRGDIVLGVKEHAMPVDHRSWLVSVVIWGLVLLVSVAIIDIVINPLPTDGAGLRASMVSVTTDGIGPHADTIGSTTESTPPSSMCANGSPLGPAMPVITQGYTGSTHQPTAQWGGIDLAVAHPRTPTITDPGVTAGATVFATHSGRVSVHPMTWPGGNVIVIIGDTPPCRTVYAHLDRMLVEDGTSVTAGTPIGTVGMTGMATGPHLHYEVWEMEGSQWVNRDPTPTIGGVSLRGAHPLPTAVVAPTDHRLSACQIDHLLALWGSPAVGTGVIWYTFGVWSGIDPAFGLAVFRYESGAATNPTWAGWLAHGETTYNVGNIICAGYPTCAGRFRVYQSWGEGIEDWFDLIRREYVEGRNHRTVADILPVYAPPHENATDAYIATVTAWMTEWYRDPPTITTPCPWEDGATRVSASSR